MNVAAFAAGGGASGTSGQWTSGTGGAMYYTGGNVGIGTASPNAQLALGRPLAGTTLSPTLVTNAGILGSSSGGELVLSSFGFLSGNNEELGIHALRTANGSDWTTTAIGIEIDGRHTQGDGFKAGAAH